MGCLWILTFLLFIFTYCVMCSGKYSPQNNIEHRETSNLFPHLPTTLRRQQRATLTTNCLHHSAARPKRSEKYDSFVYEYPRAEVDEALQLGIDRIPFNDYNRIVSALKEMLRAREEKNVLLRPRPGRRSMGDAFPLWHYLTDDVGNVPLGVSDTVAFVGDAGDQLADASLKKSAPFKPRLGKRTGKRICE